MILKAYYFNKCSHSYCRCCVFAVLGVFVFHLVVLHK